MSARLGRTDRSRLGEWFWTIDHVLLALVIVLIGVGLIAVAAASPAAAHRYSGGSYQLSDLHYLKRQIFWAALGLPLMIGASMLSVRDVKRIGVVGAGLCLLALIAVPFVGMEANGAARWLAIGPVQIQPSEFLKPLFIIAMAVILAVRFDDARAPAIEATAALLALVVFLLVRQPDFGQTMLFVAVWLLLASLVGLRPIIIAGGALAAIAGLTAAFFLVPHVHDRLLTFATGSGDRYQVESALNCFRAGGLFGVGPGEGKMKMRLPEAHTDYIFAVIGEEFGAVACIAIALLFVAVVLRAVMRAVESEEPFVFLAGVGLAAQFGLQAAINMAVNVHLLPSKGMTLPFISHGGSSFLALSLGMGLLLALTRRNPYAKASPYRWAAA